MSGNNTQPGTVGSYSSWPILLDCISPQGINLWEGCPFPIGTRVIVHVLKEDTTPGFFYGTDMDSTNVNGRRYRGAPGDALAFPAPYMPLTVGCDLWIYPDCLVATEPSEGSGLTSGDIILRSSGPIGPITDTQGEPSVVLNANFNSGPGISSDELGVDVTHLDFVQFYYWAEVSGTSWKFTPWVRSNRYHDQIAQAFQIARGYDVAGAWAVQSIRGFTGNTRNQTPFEFFNAQTIDVRGADRLYCQMLAFGGIISEALKAYMPVSGTERKSNVRFGAVVVDDFADIHQAAEALNRRARRQTSNRG